MNNLSRVFMMSSLWMSRFKAKVVNSDPVTEFSTP